MRLLIPVLILFGQYADCVIFNPVISDATEDIADPFIIHHKNVYYAVTTMQSTPPYLFMYFSTDLQSWSRTPYMMDNNRPDWLLQGRATFHGPEIHASGDYHFTLYFNAIVGNTSYICAAYAGEITGPYYFHPKALLSQTEESTEPYPFMIPTTLVENGNRIMYYISTSLADAIFFADLRAGGFEFITESINNADLKVTGQIWSNRIIKKNGMYYLFYSAGECGQENIYVARATNYRGYFTSSPRVNVSLIKSVQTPRNIAIIAGPEGRDMILFDGTDTEGCGGHRSIYAAFLRWDVNGWPYVEEDL